MAEMTAKQKASLPEINDLLAQIKTKINDGWGPMINEQRELILFIKDKKGSPWRKQTEDIEGDIDEMRMLSR